MLHSYTREVEKKSSNIPNRWDAILQKHDFLQKQQKLHEQLKQSSGLLYHRNELSNLREQLSQEGSPLLKKNEKNKYSVVSSDEGGLFALGSSKEYKVGEGSFGKVILAQNLKTGALCLVKKLYEHTYKQASFSEECKYLKLVGDLEGKQVAGKNKNYIFMRIAPGISLDDFLNIVENGNPLNMDEKIKFSLSLLEALTKLEKNRIQHNDLVCNNIFVDPRTMTITIIDYGNASKLPMGCVNEDVAICVENCLDFIKDDKILKRIFNQLMEVQDMDSAKKAIESYQKGEYKSKSKSTNKHGTKRKWESESEPERDDNSDEFMKEDSLSDENTSSENSTLDDIPVNKRPRLMG